MIRMILMSLVLVTLTGCWAAENLSNANQSTAQAAEHPDGKLYKAWLKAHDSNMYFDEWLRLKKAGMLPK